MAATRVAGERRTQTKGDRQRRAILDAVAELLAEVPIEDLSIGRITARAGITRSAYYFYFDGKYSAVAAAVADAFVDLDESTALLARLPGEDLADYARRMVATAVATWRRHAALLEACFQARPVDDRLRAMLDERSDQLIDRIRQVIDTERAGGAVTPVHPDTAELARLLGGMTLWTLREATITGRDDEFDQVVDPLTAIWIAAIGAPRL